MQDEVHAPHPRDDAHRADVRRAFVCPEREFHGQTSSAARRIERARKKFGEVARLLVALDRREQQFDRPFRGQAFGLERIGEAEAADHEVGACGAAAIELTVDVLALAEPRRRRQQLQLLRHDAGD